MKQVKDVIVPNLEANGLLAHDPETGNYQPATSWEQRQQIIEYNSKKKQQQTQAQQIEPVIVNQSDNQGQIQPTNQLNQS